MVDHRDNKLQDYHMQKSAGTQDNSYLKPLRIKDLTNQYASLIAYLGKKLLAVQETWIRSLGLEDPLEKEMASLRWGDIFFLLWHACIFLGCLQGISIYKI